MHEAVSRVVTRCRACLTSSLACPLQHLSERPRKWTAKHRCYHSPRPSVPVPRCAKFLVRRGVSPDISQVWMLTNSIFRAWLSSRQLVIPISDPYAWRSMLLLVRVTGDLTYAISLHHPPAHGARRHNPLPCEIQSIIKMMLRRPRNSHGRCFAVLKEKTHSVRNRTAVFRNICRNLTRNTRYVH